MKHGTGRKRANMSKKTKKPCDWCGDTWLSSISQDNLTFCDKFCQEEYKSRAKPKVMVDMSKVDWTMLKEQKEALLVAIGFGVSVGGYHPNPVFEAHVEGLINLIDYIQDEAAKVLGSDAVFGIRTQEVIDEHHEEAMAIIGIVNKINQQEDKESRRPVTRKRKK